jgi:pimeloyl-ACP methyl ester carboxylesterase
MEAMMQTRNLRAGEDCWTFDEGGDGATVIMLHGIPGWRGTWAAVIGELESRARIIAPDLLGFGESTTPRRGLHAAEQATALLDLLDELKVTRAHVVGFDYGGPIAASLHAQRSSLFMSLTLIATNAFPDAPLPGPLKIARVPLVGDCAFRIFCSRAGLRAMHRFGGTDRGAFPAARFERSLASSQGVHSTRDVFLHSLRDLARLYTPIEEALRAVRVPTTVLWGERDPFFSLEHGRRTASLFPGARFVSFSGCGHFVPEERPALVASEIARLVS